MKPHYRLTYRESSVMGRKIAYFIPISGAEFTEIFEQGPCGYCNELYGSLSIYNLPVRFKPRPPEPRLDYFKIAWDALGFSKKSETLERV